MTDPGGNKGGGDDLGTSSSGIHGRDRPARVDHRPHSTCSQLVASIVEHPTVAYMRLRRIRAFTLLKLAVSLGIASFLGLLTAAAAISVLNEGRQEAPRRVLSVFISAQLDQWDLVGDWYSPAAATVAIKDVTVVDGTIASDDERTVSMTTFVDGDGVAFIAGAVQGVNGTCLVWRAAQADSSILDKRYELNDGSACTGSTAANATGGSLW